jgi:hypothetical protein
MSIEIPDFPEIDGMRQTGVEDEELVRLIQHPQATQFIRERLDDIDTMADPHLQESIRQMEAGELVDITPEN